MKKINKREVALKLTVILFKKIYITCLHSDFTIHS